MLVDPRGTVHATTGVLPTKVLDIPDAQFMAALHNIEVTFLTAPLLTQPGTVEVNLPTEPGYAWSWKERTAQGWTETPGDDLAEPPTGAALGAADELREGWLTLRPEAPGDKETDAR